MIDLATACIVALIFNGLTYALALFLGKRDGYHEGYMDGVIDLHTGQIKVQDLSEGDE